MKYKHIIWDWNGTLFDDIDTCIESINELLEKRKLDLITSKDYYREIFCFPVIGYYQKLGFDFNQEPFSKVADEYIASYHKKCKRSSLMPKAEEVIDLFNDLSIKQTVISASEQNSLFKQMEPFKIKDKFEDVIGISDIYARSKIDLAKHYFQTNHLNYEEVLFVGDTVHDFEVSKALECDCILIPNGHQSTRILKNNHVMIAEDFKELVQLIKDEI